MRNAQSDFAGVGNLRGRCAEADRELNRLWKNYLRNHFGVNHVEMLFGRLGGKRATRLHVERWKIEKPVGHETQF